MLNHMYAVHTESFHAVAFPGDIRKSNLEKLLPGYMSFSGALQ